MVNFERVNDFPIVQRKGLADPVEFGDQHPEIKPLQIEAAQVTARQELEQARAIRSKLGSCATSESAIPCTAVAASGMGTPGLTRRQRASLRPSGKTLMTPISTIGSVWVSVPVVSRSITANGRLKINLLNICGFAFLNGAGHRG
jgi:hypothetical protein